MPHAVIGARVHSGWAAIVALTGDPASPEVIDRRRAVIVDSTVKGATQPYHFAEKLTPEEAAKYLDRCAAACEANALKAARAMMDELAARGHRIERCAILRAAGRPLPALPGILASHALIHTAEGEFFRNVLRKACAAHGIAVAGIRERDLENVAQAMFGPAATQLQQKIAGMGRSIGPPWTQDQKSAALAASIVLADICRYPYSKAPTPSLDW